MRGACGRAALAVLAAGLAGCGGGDDPDDLRDAASGDGSADQGPADQAIDQPPGEASTLPPTKLDLVLVIDNSIGMLEEQEQLGRSFPPLLAQLQARAGGPPDLRVAILSANFGAGALPLSPECDNLGDGGRFLVRGPCGLAPGERWLRRNPQGGGNFTGEVAAVLACLTRLGTGGCGFEHHLQSLRAAFSPLAASTNVGFLRDDARLGIIILADEDDCSAEPEATFFNQAIAGQMGSLRCALRGHQCNGQPVPAMAGFSAPLASCAPQVHANSDEDRRERLINVSTFVNDLTALKGGRADRIVVSVIVGWDDDPAATYRLEQLNASGGPTIWPAAICTNSDPGAGIATPGVRLRAFAQAFPRHTVHSICAGDLHPTMTTIGRTLAAALDAP